MIVKKFVIGIVPWLVCSQILTASDLPVGARSLGMGATYVALANSSDAIFLNPGGLDQIQGTFLSFFYQKPFGISELNFGTISVTFPLLGQRIGLGLSTFGNSLLQESTVIIGYGNSYLERFYYGFNLSIQNLSIHSYGSATSYGIDLGFLTYLNPNITWGFFLKNINRPKRGKIPESLPKVFVSGFSVKPDSRWIFNLEIYKDVRFPEEIRFGFEYSPLKSLFVRAGVANHPARFASGFGIKIKAFLIDYAFITHNDLGMTHQISFSIHIKPRKKEPPVVAQTNDEINHSRQFILIKEKININTATLKQLMKIQGLGKTLASRIIQYRTEHGPFEKLEDLLKVRGIGKKIFIKIKDQLIIKKVVSN